MRILGIGTSCDETAAAVKAAGAEAPDDRVIDGVVENVAVA